uniref:Uncharacterized protein n=1 Tax=Arundo donax TaxID=35708 RepID=A0A0A8ZRD5_ARUDO
MKAIFHASALNNTRVFPFGFMEPIIYMFFCMFPCSFVHNAHVVQGNGLVCIF